MFGMNFCDEIMGALGAGGTLQKTEVPNTK